MRHTIAVLVVCLCPAFAADTDFNGRWDISIPGSPGRAWWLEVQGAGMPSPKVKFVSAYAGDLNVADEVTIQGGELVFGFRYKQRRNQNEEPVAVHQVFRARLTGAEMNGTSEAEGSNRPPTKWIGVRAPEIKDKDDGSWRAGKPVSLFDGKDLNGWQGPDGRAPSGWSVVNGVLKTTGGAANLISGQKFWNFKLHLEYNVAKGSNSGVGLRGRYEVQIQDDYGRPPNTHSNSSLYSRIAPRVNAAKPAGEWQTYDIRLVGRDLTVVLNGTTVIDKQVVEGLTAMGHDPDEGLPGPLSLQGDHGPVDFRNIVVTPLAR